MSKPKTVKVKKIMRYCFIPESEIPDNFNYTCFGSDGRLHEVNSSSQKGIQFVFLICVYSTGGQKIKQMGFCHKCLDAMMERKYCQCGELDKNGNKVCSKVQAAIKQLFENNGVTNLMSQ